MVSLENPKFHLTIKMSIRVIKQLNEISSLRVLGILWCCICQIKPKCLFFLSDSGVLDFHGVNLDEAGSWEKEN